MEKDFTKQKEAFAELLDIMETLREKCQGSRIKSAGKVKGEILEKKTPHAGLEPATLSLEG